MEWIYGRNVVRMALSAGARRRAYRLVATAPALKSLGAALPGGLRVEVESAREIEALAGSAEHQGVALQVDAFRYAPLDAVAGGDLVVVLDEVSDPHNLGAVARSAAAAGAAGMVLPKHRSAAVTPAAVKASAGIIEHMPIVQVANVTATLNDLKARGFWVYGAAGGVQTSFWSLDLTGPVALVFGAEGRGLRPLVARTCDVLAAIPVQPPVESLNVSVAAALFLFEARRQRASSAAAPSPSRP